MHEYLVPLVNAFKQHKNQGEAAYMSAYLKNQFEFLGIKTKLRRDLQKDFLSQNELPPYEWLEMLVMDLYAMPEREFHAFARELCFKLKKHWQLEIIQLFEWMILHNSWWDSVDYISSDLVGTYFKKFPENVEEITLKWNSGSNMWLNRASIIFQIMYKQNTNTALLERNIKHHLHSKEFFLQKAIGWSLRQYSRIDKEWVADFVSRNKLRPLSEREAMRLIKANLV